LKFPGFSLISACEQVIERTADVSGREAVMFEKRRRLA
jgi:hypothetical protein